MSAHTPGPWEADIPCATEHLWAREARVRAPSWGVVATIGLDTSLPHWDEPQRANARLIAAAPELLEMAEALQAVCARIIEQYGCVQCGIDFHALGSAVNRVLDKATGAAS